MEAYVNTSSEVKTVAFLSIREPIAYCVCGLTLEIPEGVLKEPEGAGGKYEVKCECGEIWGFDNFPKLKPGGKRGNHGDQKGRGEG